MRKAIVREDNILEMITALLFLTVAILGFRRIFTTPRTSRNDFYWVVPTFAAIAFLEEVSFLRAFFDEKPIVEGVKIDAIHDFLRVMVSLYESTPYAGMILITALLLSIILMSFLFWVFRRKLEIPARLHWFHLFLISVALVLVALLLDLGFASHAYLVFFEEFLEAVSALALFFAYRAEMQLGAEPSVESNSVRSS